MSRIKNTSDPIMEHMHPTKSATITPAISSLKSAPQNSMITSTATRSTLQAARAILARRILARRERTPRLKEQTASSSARAAELGRGEDHHGRLAQDPVDRQPARGDGGGAGVATRASQDEIASALLRDRAGAADGAGIRHVVGTFEDHCGVRDKIACHRTGRTSQRSTCRAEWLSRQPPPPCRPSSALSRTDLGKTAEPIRFLL